MRSALIASLVLLPVAAAAASLEEDYFAARDAFIDKFRAANVDDKRIVAQEADARGELEKQLRKIIGALAFKGFPTPGKINLENLVEGDGGFGLLDGLLHSSADGKTQILVTTDALFGRWLREHKDWWGPKVANVPQDVDAALMSEPFYTQALRTDAAIGKYAELPVVKPADSKFAFAMLVARSQDVGPRTPDELIVSVLEGNHVFVVSAPARARIEPMPVCRTIWREAVRKAEQARAAYVASKLKDDRLFEQSTRLEEEGDVAFRRCFAQHAKSHRSLTALTRQAQGLVDRLRGR